MPYYIGLEDYLEPQNKLRVNAHYKTENTVASNFADDRLTELATALLKKAVLAAKALQSKGLQTQDVSGSMSVKDRAKFFAENTPAKLADKQKELNDRVIFVRKWLSRQGAHFRGDYDIDHFKLQGRRVAYDTDIVREGGSRVNILGGTFYYALSPKGSRGSKVDTGKMVTHFSGPGKAIYVLSGQGHLHIGSHKVGQYHHSSLLAGKPVACGGELEIKDGRLVYLSNKSGHYVPGKDDFLHVLAVFQKRGVFMQFPVHFNDNGTMRKFDDVSAFLESVDLDNDTVNQIRAAAVATDKLYADNPYLYNSSGYASAASPLAY